MIPCTETHGLIHARVYAKTLCGKDGALNFDIGVGQWGERDEQHPPLRWCKDCEGFLRARGIVRDVAKPRVEKVSTWADELIDEPVRDRSKK